MLESFHRNAKQLSEVVDIIVPATSCSHAVGTKRLKALERERRGSLLPLAHGSVAWSLQLLDVALMQHRSRLFAEGLEFWTYWTADSSPIRERNWMNSGFWQVLVISFNLVFSRGASKSQTQDMPMM